MILNNNSTQQINTLVIQLQNRITNLNNELKSLNKEISNLDSKISDLEIRDSSNANEQANDIAAMNAKIKANTEAISGKADKSHTHAKSEITDFPTSLKNPNALTINGKTYDGSTAVDAGVQTVANGGTGVTSQADINKAFVGNLELGDSDVTDSTEFVSSYASDNGFAETADGALNKPYKRKFSKVWNYIKGKISSVLGLTADNYGGKSAKSSFLDEYPGAGGARPTSGNIVPKDSSEYGGMRKDVVTSSMTDSGHPGQDGHLLTMFWDNSGRHDSQFFISNEKQPTTVKVRVKGNEADYGPWVDLITSQSIGSQTVAKAGTADSATTAYKIEPNYTSKTLTEVTSYTDKYIKLAYCNWYDTGTLQVYLGGNNFADTLVINFGGGNSVNPMLCGHYSGNSHRVYSVIAQKGSAWNSGYSIYVKVGQETNLTVNVALLTGNCTIGISESTTAPTDISEWPVSYGLFGNIVSPEITNLEQRVAALESKA